MASPAIASPGAPPLKPGASMRPSFSSEAGGSEAGGFQAGSSQAGDPQAGLTAAFERLRRAQARDGAPDHHAREMSLRALLEQVVRHQAAFAAAISADFGHRATIETDLGEILMVVNGIKHARRNLGRWMRPQRRSVAWHFRPGNARVLHQPLGVIGIIAPWNYPVQLSLAPLTAAIAAGNRVMLKPSEFTPRTAELLHRILGEIFPDDQI